MGDFRQKEPHEGEPATERTQVRVLFDDKNLYVGIRAFDSEHLCTFIHFFLNICAKPVTAHGLRHAQLGGPRGPRMPQIVESQVRYPGVRDGRGEAALDVQDVPARADVTEDVLSARRVPAQAVKQLRSWVFFGTPITTVALLLVRALRHGGRRGRLKKPYAT